MTTHSETNDKLATQPSGGPAVDGQGIPVIDPTRNVLDLVSAAIQRQDDLRYAESHHIREIVALRADYDEKLRDAEASRIDAIRAVDVGAVNRAAEVATTQATTLAAQVSTSAETLRGQVAAAANAATIALAAALEPVQKDIADLRRAQYEAQGQKINVVDTQALNTGQRQSSSLVVAVIIGTSTILIAIIGLIITILTRGK